MPVLAFAYVSLRAKSDPLKVNSSLQNQSGPLTIDYTYDPLNRLTAADYSTGDYYHYTYDSVGNRLSQEKSVNGLPSTVTYQYDIANRLTSVNGVNYTWDDNGNLLSDGTNTYTYDPANRLSSVTSNQLSVTYGYNGLGDRLTENNTRYVLDLNTDLTQVLDDGTNTYLYGIDRIAQVSDTNGDYFLGDAIGSTRQLTDASGAITLAQRYDPFENGVTSTGSASSIFGYTGEQTDLTGLQYLRARYYDPYLNQFIQPDTIVPDPFQPMDWNHYLYVRDNPVNYTDPSGHCSGNPQDLSNPDLACWQEIEQIEANYSNIVIAPANWHTNELKAVEKGLRGMTYVFGDKHIFYFVFDRTITLKRAGWWANLFAGNKQGRGVPRTATITFYNNAFNTNDDIGTAVVIHEFGHFLDARFGYPSMAGFKDIFWNNCIPDPFTGNCLWFLNPQCKPYPFDQPSAYGGTSPKEDFAETFAEYVWYKNGWDFSPVSSQIFLPDPQRLDYMEKLIGSIQAASNSSR